MEQLIIQKVIQINHGYYRLLLSNGEEREVHEDLLVRYQLLVGRELTLDFLDELAYEGEVHRGYRMAIRYLSYRPRSTYEVEAYLHRKEIDPINIQEILSRLIEKGALDDQSFAHKWVENRQLLRPKGKFALRAELKEKGIAKLYIDQALEQLDHSLEKEIALEMGRKKMKQLTNKTWQEARNKIGRYLSYKGYEMELILDILGILEGEFS